jgi:predicted MFS family arabinose efflux permease
MALAIGTIVANLYYLQPLLHLIRGDFRVSIFAASSLVTLMQAGYAVGLITLVPLGDLVARRRLVVGIFVASALSMELASLAHSYGLFALLTVVIGLTSIAGQILIPFGADLADPATRGRSVGRLTTGLLAGVLLSRTVSGFLSESVGWRGVFRVAGLALLVIALLLSRVLPDEAPRPRLSYRDLLRGAFQLFATSAPLRRRCWYGATAFGAFSVLWTTLAFHLAARPFSYSSGVIGLFGLVGMAGILGANLAGRGADARREHEATRIGAAAVLVSFLLLGLSPGTLLGVVAGVVVLDAGTQMVHVSNQSVIYALAPDQRSRVNSIYMLSFFTGATLGSLFSASAYSHWGWTGTCVVGALFGLGALVPSLFERQYAALSDPAPA